MAAPIPPPLRGDRKRYDNLPAPMAAMEDNWPSGASTGWHAHPKDQLLYAIAGVMLVESDAGAWVVPPNRALWLLAGVRHNVTMSGEVMMRTAYIDASRVPDLPAQSCVINVSPLLRALLVEAVHVPLDYAPDTRDDRLMRLLIDEVRVSPTVPVHLPMPREARLKPICDALMREPGSPAVAADWALRARMGERTLHRLFLAETGMTFAQWREQARLLHALPQLARGDKVIDIALACGYASQSAFTAMFRRHFGMPPSAFYRSEPGQERDGQQDEDRDPGR